MKKKRFNKDYLINGINLLIKLAISSKLVNDVFFFRIFFLGLIWKWKPNIMKTFIYKIKKNDLAFSKDF